MDQLTRLLTGLNLKQRISIVAAAVMVIAGMIGFVHWRHEGNFRPLYTSMAPEDAAGVVQKLKETGVEYRLADNGAAVMVPSDKLPESRLALAAAGLPKTGRIGFELFDKTSFGTTEFVEHINYKRALEGELERSVMSLAEVEQARVHVSLPKESVFLDQQQPAKASVMLKLRPGAQISSSNVLAVTNLVASAVEGLNPEAVSVVDMNGTLLSRPKKGPGANSAELTGEMLEARQQMERTLIAKISETLEPLLGAGKFRAGASVDIDLTSGEQQEETLDPEHSVMVSSQKTEDVNERSAASGTPGTASNLPQQGASAPKGGSGTSRRTESVTYQTSRLVRHTMIPQGVVRRMSLAVLLDQGVRWEGEGAARQRVMEPPPPETLKTIRDLVAAVTGLNEQRGDQLVVETLPFESSLKAAPPPSGKPGAPIAKRPEWLEMVNKYHDLWAPLSLGLAVLLVLIRGIFRLGRRAPKREVRLPAELPEGAGAPELEAGEASADDRELAAPAMQESGDLTERVRLVANREPALAVNVLRMWLQENATKTS